MYVRVCVYVCMGVCVNVCVYVRPYVCGSVAAKTDGSILIKFSTNDLTNICEVRFSRILTFPNDDVMAVIFALFRWGTLTVAIFVRFSSKFNTR